MPTDRFYHLPKSKQTVIREAALREFTRAPLEQVSINRIVADAGISRGSFYTYFEDKRDVMMYLLQDVKHKMERFCMVCLRARQGDFFLMMEDAFDYVVTYMKEGDHIRLYHNMLFNSDLFEQLLSGQLSGQTGHMERPGLAHWFFEQKELERWFFEHVNLRGEHCRQPIRERFTLLMEITGPMMMRGACEYCYGNGGFEEAKQKFHEKLELLKSIVFE